LNLAIKDNITTKEGPNYHTVKTWSTTSTSCVDVCTKFERWITHSATGTIFVLRRAGILRAQCIAVRASEVERKLDDKTGEMLVKNIKYNDLQNMV
jgi:hypothetical protein